MSYLVDLSSSLYTDKEKMIEVILNKIKEIEEKVNKRIIKVLRITPDHDVEYWGEVEACIDNSCHSGECDKCADIMDVMFDDGSVDSIALIYPCNCGYAIYSNDEIPSSLLKKALRVLGSIEPEDLNKYLQQRYPFVVEIV